MTDPNEYASFIRAVIAEPDNDLPRLMMADWLQERGEPARAEFIRVQCELARHQPLVDIGDDGHLPAPVQKYHDRLRRRERELWDANSSIWRYQEIPTAVAAYIGTAPTDHPNHAIYRRGFVDEIALSWMQWTRHADAIRAATPISKVRLTSMPHDSLYEPFFVEWPKIQFELPTDPRLFAEPMRVG